MVFSAFDPQARFNGYPYRRYYTSYKIFSPDGQLLQTVQNDNGTLAEGPREVALTPGTYRVIARANGRGFVTVPVVIVPDRVTTVHLEGAAAWSEKSPLARSNPVRLPDGEIVGWRSPGSSAGH